MSNTDKRTYWQHHIDAWQAGDLSQKAYCKTQGISLASFDYWRKRLASLSCDGMNTKFVAVGAAPVPAVIRLDLPAGIVLDVPAGSLAGVLPVVYQAMRVGGDA